MRKNHAMKKGGGRNKPNLARERFEGNYTSRKITETCYAVMESWGSTSHTSVFGLAQEKWLGGGIWAGFSKTNQPISV